jgi:AcrR family transcriptional regulator
MSDEAAVAEPGAPTQPGALTKGERTRQRLLELAVERFGARGYRSTSVSEIARAAGLTQAAAYAYFPSKEALFDAAVDSDATALVAETEQRTTEVEARQLVPMLLMLFLGALDRHPLVKRVLSGQEPDALARLVDLPVLGRLTGEIADAVRTAQGRGEVRTDIDADLFASGAEALVLSLLLSVTQVGSSTQSRRQLGVLTIFDAALRAPQPG